MHDEVAHLGVVDGFSGLRLPGLMGLLVIGIDPDDVELPEVFEGDPLQIFELAPEHQMQKLARLVRRRLMCSHQNRPIALGPCAVSAACSAGLAPMKPRRAERLKSYRSSDPSRSLMIPCASLTRRSPAAKSQSCL